MDQVSRADAVTMNAVERFDRDKMARIEKYQTAIEAGFYQAPSPGGAAARKDAAIIPLSGLLAAMREGALGRIRRALVWLLRRCH